MTTPQNCSSCNALVEEGELIHFAEQQVCIHCKDRYAQRLKEGLAPDDESADKLIRQLEFGGSIKLILFSVFTIGIYQGHYMLRQSQRMNEHLHSDDKMPVALAWWIMIHGYLAALFDFGRIAGELDPNLQLVSAGSDSLLFILIVVWGFIARGRMNRFCGAMPGSSGWFHGFWTFLLTPLYFNYKVNRIAEGR